MENLRNLWNLLRITFTIVPVVAGLDKFSNLLVDWKIYLGPFENLIPFDTDIFMMVVGIIEIIAGILVFTRTHIGAYVVMGWLICISIVLISRAMGKSNACRQHQSNRTFLLIKAAARELPISA